MTTNHAADLLLGRGISAPIETAVVLGTGLGSVAGIIEPRINIPYAELPGFPATSVSGHAGELVIGTRNGKTIAILQGRAHYYESGNAAAMAFPFETLARLGVTSLILTCSAGSLSADLKPGDVVAVSDHINLTGINPLIGMGSDDRFVNLVDAYDPALRQHLGQAAARLGQSLLEGVYMWFPGPSFETPAEIKVARALGADLVGMSIVPEVILARRLGLRVAALALVTNFAAGFAGGSPSHAETKEIAAQGARALKHLLASFLAGNAETS